MEMPSVVVTFKDVTASREVHVGDRSLPTLPNALLSMLEGMVAPLTRLLGLQEGKKRTVTMLDGVSGVLKPVSWHACMLPVRGRLN